MSENNDFIQLPPIKKDTPSEVLSMIWQYLKLPEESRKRVTVTLWIVFCKYCSHRILSPYRSINYQLQKSEAFQSVHHVTLILCYTVL